MNAFAQKVANRVYDSLWLAPQGLGKPVSAAAWDRGFASGKWDHLYEMSETTRYAVIHNYVVKAKSRASILDIGCGAGVLRSFFSDKEIANYKGFDISEEAVKRSNAKGYERSEFVVSDFDRYQFDGHSDVVVFNESIGYAKDPGSTFRKYFGALSNDGLCIVSMHDYGMRSRAAWRRIERHVKPRFSSRLANEKKQVWDVKIFFKS